MLTIECLVFGEPPNSGEKRRTNPSLHEVAREFIFDSGNEAAVLGDMETGDKRGRGCGVDGPTNESASPLDGSEEGLDE